MSWHGVWFGAWTSAWLGDGSEGPPAPLNSDWLRIRRRRRSTT